MADSLCGPSNALQNFQKHSSVDRTLQQDRLIARQPQPQASTFALSNHHICAERLQCFISVIFNLHRKSTNTLLQGFRSAPGPNAGVLDPEFQAFQAGSFPLESQQGFRSISSSYTPQNLQPGLDGAWANDFQRLQVSNQAPNSAHLAHQTRHTTINAQAPGGWAQDFHQTQGDQRLITSQQLGPGGYQYSPRQNGMQRYGGPMMGGAVATRNVTSMQQAPEMFNEATFDEAAFAKAFDDAIENAAQAELEQEQDMPQDQIRSQAQDEEIMISESAERFMDPDIDQGQLLNQAPIGADIIHDPTDKSYPQPTQEDHTELARTAGHLLNGMSSNNIKYLGN